MSLNLGTKWGRNLAGFRPLLDWTSLHLNLCLYLMLQLASFLAPPGDPDSPGLGQLPSLLSCHEGKGGKPFTAHSHLLLFLSGVSLRGSGQEFICILDGGPQSGPKNLQRLENECEGTLLEAGRRRLWRQIIGNE